MTPAATHENRRRSMDEFRSEIEEVDVEVGFILGCTCTSLELEEDDDLEEAEAAV
jgi:hypothetical protein